MKIIVVFLAMFLSFISIIGQEFYFGNDLSYANMMEDCGAAFKEKGVVKDVYKIFADHGTNLVRVRLWYNPTWQNSIVQPAGVKNQYNDFKDAKESIKRAKEAGMHVMLGIHYSDTWADPAKQIIPSVWVDVANNLEALKDSVYNYTIQVLDDLNKEGLLPEFIKVGNENNGGILRHTVMNDNLSASGSVSTSWSRHAQLFSTAFKAIRDYTDTTALKPKIVIHFADIKNIDWGAGTLISNGATDFDIIGFSYYYAWHDASIAAMGQKVKQLVDKYTNYDVMVVETGYLWSTQNYDNLGNIITEPDPEYLPVCPEKQLEYMVDFTKSVMNNGGIGVVFWEPAWVSTPCSNPWGQGSSQEHVAFFDIQDHNFMENGGGRWTETVFYKNINNVVVTFKVDMTGQDVSNGVYITGSFTGTNWELLPMYNAGNNIYTYITSMAPGDSGAYYFLNNNNWESREKVPASCATMWGTDRKFVILNDNVIFSDKWAGCQGITIPTEVNVTFKVNMTGQDVSRGVYITGEINGWDISKMSNLGDGTYSYSVKLVSGTSYPYYFLTTSSWNNYLDYREIVPSECALMWNSDRLITVPDKDTIVEVAWGSCTNIVNIRNYNQKNNAFSVYPIPCNAFLFIENKTRSKISNIEIVDLLGKQIKKFYLNEELDHYMLNVSDIPNGIQVIKISSEINEYYYKAAFQK